MNKITEKMFRDATTDALEHGMPENEAEMFAELAVSKAVVYNDPRFPEFSGMDKEIERVIAGCPDMLNLHPVNRYVLAGLAVRAMTLSN